MVNSAAPGTRASQGIELRVSDSASHLSVRPSLSSMVRAPGVDAPDVRLDVAAAGSGGEASKVDGHRLFVVPASEPAGLHPVVDVGGGGTDEHRLDGLYVAGRQPLKQAQLCRAHPDDHKAFHVPSAHKRSCHNLRRSN